MAVMYTVEQCETELATIEAQIAELRGLPTSGTVGKTSLNMSGTLAELRRERMTWERRLDAAYNGGFPLVTRRVG
ncbi:MAG: hypothetical protein AB7U18_23590 [Dehalococcoidia bacterium]